MPMELLSWIEKHMLLVAAIVFAAFNLLVLLVLMAYVRANGLPDGAIKQRLDKIVFEIDKTCDNLESPAKRSLAIIQLQQVLGWKRIFLPTAVIGWMIDAEIAVIRKMQQVTGIPDLHKGEDANNG